MANDLTGNPLIIDTAMDTSLARYSGPKYLPVALQNSSNPLGVRTSRFRIVSVVWKNPANNNVFVLTDGSGNSLASPGKTLLAANCSTGNAGFPQSFDMGKVEVADLWVSSITGGSLYITLDESD